MAAPSTHLVGAGAVWAAACLLDPSLRGAAVIAPLLAGAGLVLAHRRHRLDLRHAGATILALTWTAAACSSLNLGADSRSYFAYLPSAAFDHDLDFGDEFEEWGFRDLPADSPLRHGWHPVGPALLWSPLYALAHVYVRVGAALGRAAYTPDGFAAPYVRAAWLGTIAIAVTGGLLLFVTLRRWTDAATAAVAVVGTVLASTIPYYLLVQPLMAHGIVFGVASALVWALDRAEESATPRRWAAAGALFGLLVLCRWQAVAAGLLVAAVAGTAFARRRVTVRALAVAAAAALAVFLPQVVAWKIQHGRWLTLPQGSGYLNWSSPHVVDVLLSADHGLFTWTPVALAGIAGLAALLRTRTAWAAGSLATIVVTAWVNGSVTDWAGSDAFGARRFDLAVPLLTLGVAVVVRALANGVARRPLLVPALALGLLAAWNLGLARLQARGELAEVATAPRVAARQMGQLHRAVSSVLGAVTGDRGKNLAYKVFVGEYLYDNVNVGGTIDLGQPDARFLAGGWSPPRWREGGPRFRWALAPESCFRLPLQMRTDLPAVLTARAPRRLEDQAFDVHLNGRVVASGRLGPEWTDVPFTLPGGGFVPGENTVCLAFARHWGEEGQTVAAQVARLQLP